MLDIIQNAEQVSRSKISSVRLNVGSRSRLAGKGFKYVECEQQEAKATRVPRKDEADIESQLNQIRGGRSRHAEAVAVSFSQPQNQKVAVESRDDWQWFDVGILEPGPKVYSPSPTATSPKSTTTVSTTVDVPKQHWHGDCLGDDEWERLEQQVMKWSLEDHELQEELLQKVQTDL